MHEPVELDVVTAEVPQPPPLVEQSEPAPRTIALSFTGSGKEYFRIWIVNLLLTVATAGIYSAWAKVRRLQYFDRNTQLAGACFDFDGDPRAILKGRLVAVVLLVAYHYAFGFSLAVGVTVMAGLVIALPFLLRAALRFRLTHTRYRGLALGFSGSIGGAYLAYLPPVATVLWPGVMLTLYPSNELVALAFVPYLAWPAMHGMMKRYQHRHLQYGSQRSSFELPARRFFRPYLLAGLIVIAGFVAGFLLLVGAGLAMGTYDPKHKSEIASSVMALIFLTLQAYMLFLLAGPYVQVRVANLALSNTSFEGVRIRSTMTVRGMMKLQLVNVLLTVLTLGLYRPFAIVRVYQYRLAHLALEVEGDFENIIADTAPRHAGAAGDGAADFLGVDISW